MKNLKNEHGGVKIITLVTILLVVIIALLCYVAYMLYDKKNTIDNKNLTTGNTTSLKNQDEIKETYTNNLSDAQNGKIAFEKLVEKNDLKTEEHNGYYTYIDPFNNKYNIKEITKVVSEEGLMGVDNWAALFKVTVTYIDNNNKTQTMDLAIILLPNHEIQNQGTYLNYTGTTSFVRGFSELYDDGSGQN